VRNSFLSRSKVIQHACWPSLTTYF